MKSLKTLPVDRSVKHQKQRVGEIMKSVVLAQLIGTKYILSSRYITVYFTFPSLKWHFVVSVTVNLPLLISKECPPTQCSASTNVFNELE